MTYQEANALVDDFSFVYKGKSISKEMLIECREVIHKALEKQIPKKPIFFKRTAHDFQTGFCKHSGTYCEYIKPYSNEYKYTDYKCPCCKHLISDGTPSYCWNCGQALDWSEIEE